MIGIKGLLDGYYFWWCPIFPKWDIYQPLRNSNPFEVHALSQLAMEKSHIWIRPLPMSRRAELSRPRADQRNLATSPYRASLVPPGLVPDDCRVVNIYFFRTLDQISISSFRSTHVILFNRLLNESTYAYALVKLNCSTYEGVSWLNGTPKSSKIA